MILLYNIAWICLLPFIIILMIFRIIIGKEDIMRIRERLGIASITRSAKNIIWIHAASVGESRIAITLSKNLTALYPKHRILITTGTTTSANIVRTFVSAHIAHQFIPMDNYLSVWLFFRNWRPDIGIFIESELWPNLTSIGAKFCPLILINARMSDRSFKKWGRFRFIAKMLMKKFKYILCQSSKDTSKYKSLGADATFIGNLKYSATQLEVNLSHLRSIETMIGSRRVFLAASTHPGDDEIIADTHMKLRSKYPDLLTIIAPRHVIRAKEIKEMILKQGLTCKMRSAKEHIEQSTDIYIADTMGELGMLFSLAKASIICGSFKNGGHNPIEAAYFDTHIIFGPDMSNFSEIAAEFLKYKAATQINNSAELVKALSKIFDGKMPSTHEEASAIITNHANVMIRYMDYIKASLTLHHK